MGRTLPVAGAGVADVDIQRCLQRECFGRAPVAAARAAR